LCYKINIQSMFWMYNAALQRSKLTFSKNRLLATFNCKMVAIKKNSVAQKTLGNGGHFMTHYTNG